MNPPCRKCSQPWHLKRRCLRPPVIYKPARVLKKLRYEASQKLKAMDKCFRYTWKWSGLFFIARPIGNHKNDMTRISLLNTSELSTIYECHKPVDVPMEQGILYRLLIIMARRVLLQLNSYKWYLFWVAFVYMFDVGYEAPPYRLCFHGWLP